MRVLWFLLVVSFRCAQAALARTITEAKEYWFETPETERIVVSLPSTTDTAILHFTGASGTEHLLQGTDSNYNDEGLYIGQGNVILDIAEGVTLKIATYLESKYYATRNGKNAIMLGPTPGNALTIQGKGTVFIWGTESPISSQCTSSSESKGQLTIKGSPTVYFVTQDDDPAVSNLSAISIEGGTVYAIPNRTIESIIYITKPIGWSLYTASSKSMFEAEVIELKGGAVLGAARTSSSKPSTLEDVLKYQTYTGEMALIHTGGSYLSGDEEMQMVLLESGVTSVPGACYTFDGTTACTGEFLPDQYGRIFLPKGATPRYASAGHATAVDFFGLEPTYSAEGLIVEYAFGLERASPVLNDQGEWVVQLDVGIEFPNEPASTTTKDLQLCVTEKFNGETQTVYDAVTTLTRVGETARFTAVVQTSAPFMQATVGTAEYTITATTVQES